MRIHVENVVLFLGLTGDMQSLAGSGEVWGKGAIYLLDLPAACTGACQDPVLPCPNLLYVLLTTPVPCSCSWTSPLTLQECWRPAAAQEAATIMPCASWHLECIMPFDFPITLEVAFQLNAKSQAWRISFQLFVDSMQHRPGDLPTRNWPTKHNKAI